MKLFLVKRFLGRLSLQIYYCPYYFISPDQIMERLKELLEKRCRDPRDSQPRPEGLLAFQNGGSSGEDPGTQQITCLQRGWRCIQNGGYGEKGEKNGYEMLR